MSAVVEDIQKPEPAKPLVARIDWVKASPWLYTIALFAIWEASVRLFDLPYTVLPGLREMDFGDFEMRAYAGDLEHDPQFIAWCEDVEHNICPHGESAAQVLARSVAAIEPVLRRGEDTVCVIHGGVTSGLMIHWFGGILYDYSPAPGTGYQVIFDGEKPLNYTKIG